jgi:acyl-CoA reductase-like NAD-dependent aldehyde dehydrogenase
MAVTVRTLDNFIGGAWAPSTGDTVREIVSPSPARRSRRRRKRIITFRKPNGVYAAVTPWNFPTLSRADRTGNSGGQHDRDQAL